jgi:hypothetical protein
MKIASIFSYISAAALTALIASLAASEFTTAAYGAFTIALVGMIAAREYTPRSHFVVTRASSGVRSWVTAGHRAARAAKHSKRNIALAR